MKVFIFLGMFSLAIITVSAETHVGDIPSLGDWDDFPEADYSGVVCGNGQIDYVVDVDESAELRPRPVEECDRQDFGRQTCESLGFLEGELRCTSQCLLDKSLCVPLPSKFQLLNRTLGSAAERGEVAVNTELIYSGKPNLVGVFVQRGQHYELSSYTSVGFEPFGKTFRGEGSAAGLEEEKDGWLLVTRPGAGEPLSVSAVPFEGDGAVVEQLGAGELLGIAHMSQGIKVFAIGREGGTRLVKLNREGGKSLVTHRDVAGTVLALTSTGDLMTVERAGGKVFVRLRGQQNLEEQWSHQLPPPQGPVAFPRWSGDYPPLFSTSAQGVFVRRMPHAASSTLGPEFPLLKGEVRLVGACSDEPGYALFDDDSGRVQLVQLLTTGENVVHTLFQRAGARALALGCNQGAPIVLWNSDGKLRLTTVVGPLGY